MTVYLEELKPFNLRARLVSRDVHNMFLVSATTSVASFSHIAHLLTNR